MVKNLYRLRSLRLSRNQSSALKREECRARHQFGIAGSLMRLSLVTHMNRVQLFP
jgi:hypothetical protein